ncbi:MAG: YHS domain-containing (seleno)protein [Methylococcales bacterium]
MTKKLYRPMRTAALLTVLVLGAFSAPAFAVKQTGGEYNTLYAGLGAKGYDVVSYFTDRKPKQGSDRYTAEFGGVKWQFTSEEHRDLFAADPQKYAPQYGGFCSWGVSQGKLFDVDPVNGWTVVNGKLYLNFNADLNATFAKETEGYVAKANQHWPELNR